MMRQAGHHRHGLRVRALIAVLWRGGLRISEALALNETDIDERRGSLLIRHGKGERQRQRYASALATRTKLPASSANRSRISVSDMRKTNVPSRSGYACA